MRERVFLIDLDDSPEAKASGWCRCSTPFHLDLRSSGHPWSIIWNHPYVLSYSDLVHICSYPSVLCSTQFHKNFLVVQNHYICGIRWPIEVKRRFKKVKCVGNSELSFKNILDYETINWPQVISFYDATEELLTLIYSTKYVFILW